MPIPQNNVEMFTRNIELAIKYYHRPVANELFGSRPVLGEVFVMQLLLMDYLWGVNVEKTWEKFSFAEDNSSVVVGNLEVTVKAQGKIHPMFAALSGDREYFAQLPEIPPAQTHSELLWQEINIGLDFNLRHNFSGLFMVTERERQLLEVETKNVLVVAKQLIAVNQLCTKFTQRITGGKNEWEAATEDVVHTMQAMQEAVQYRMDNCFKLLMRNHLVLTRLEIGATLEEPLVGSSRALRLLARELMGGGLTKFATGLADALQQLQHHSQEAHKAITRYILSDEIDKLSDESALKIQAYQLLFMMGYKDMAASQVTPAVVQTVLEEVKTALLDSCGQALSDYNEPLINARLQEVFYSEVVQKAVEIAYRTLTQTLKQKEELVLHNSNVDHGDAAQSLVKQSAEIGAELVKIKDELEGIVQLVLAGCSIPRVQAQATLALSLFSQQSEQRSQECMQLFADKILVGFTQKFAVQYQAAEAALEKAEQEWQVDWKKWQQDVVRLKYALALQQSYGGELAVGSATPLGSMNSFIAQMKKIVNNFVKNASSELDALPDGACKTKGEEQLHATQQALQDFVRDKAGKMQSQLDKETARLASAPPAAGVAYTNSVRVFGSTGATAVDLDSTGVDGAVAEALYFT